LETATTPLVASFFPYFVTIPLPQESGYIFGPLIPPPFFFFALLVLFLFYFTKFDWSTRFPFRYPSGFPPPQDVLDFAQLPRYLAVLPPSLCEFPSNKGKNPLLHSKGPPSLFMLFFSSNPPPPFEEFFFSEKDRISQICFTFFPPALLAPLSCP